MTSLVQDVRAGLTALPRVEMNGPIRIYRATAGVRPTIHRFYDTSPISPTGRYLAVTELPFEDHLPAPGDVANVVVVDLSIGAEVYRAATAAWDTQVGAHAQWGSTDNELYFNKLEEDGLTPYGVKVNPISGDEIVMSHTVYMVSEDGRWSASPNLQKINLVQAGYGVNLPSPTDFRHKGAPDDDGLFVTNLGNGETSLLVSLASVAEVLRAQGVLPDLSAGALYGFHVKWNLQGERLMFLVRWLAHAKFQRGTLNYLFTVKADGSELRLAIDAKRWVGGHHPNWFPDGERIVMNLRERSGSGPSAKIRAFADKVFRRMRISARIDNNPLRFFEFKYDGTAQKVIAPRLLGSGHPTIHPSGRYLLSDSYLGEKVAGGDGTVPLRWVDIAADSEIRLATPYVKPSFSGPNSELRVDPHPAWDRSGRFFSFNASPNGIRAVYIADVTELLAGNAP